MAQQLFMIGNEIETEDGKKIPEWLKDNEDIRCGYLKVGETSDGITIWSVPCVAGEVPRLQKLNGFLANNLLELTILSLELTKKIADVNYFVKEIDEDGKEVKVSKKLKYSEWENNKTEDFITITTPIQWM